MEFKVQGGSGSMDSAGSGVSLAVLQGLAIGFRTGLGCCSFRQESPAFLCFLSGLIACLYSSGNYSSCCFEVLWQALARLVTVLLTASKMWMLKGVSVA